jgi:hypothetical protein
VASNTDTWDIATLAPGDTVVSNLFDNGLGVDVAPVVVQVIRSTPAFGSGNAGTNPGRANVALTVFRTSNGRFRIAATNVSQVPVTEVQVRWWSIGG